MHTCLKDDLMALIRMCKGNLSFVQITTSINYTGCIVDAEIAKILKELVVWKNVKILIKINAHF